MTDSKSEHHRREEFPEKFTPEHNSLKGEFARNPAKAIRWRKNPFYPAGNPTAGRKT